MINLYIKHFFFSFYSFKKELKKEGDAGYTFSQDPASANLLRQSKRGVRQWVEDSYRDNREDYI